MFHSFNRSSYVATMKLRCLVVLCMCVLTVCSKGETWITFMTRLLNTGVMYNAVHGCTRGFMELELLKRRAEKISGGNNAGSTGGGLDNEFRLIPYESFSCNGNMTGLLLVGTVRTGGNRDQHPEIQIWRKIVHSDNTYTYTMRDSQEIRLTPGDFSSDGVLRYNLTTPISYHSGDVLGVYQPDQSNSVVRVYYDSNTSTTYRVNNKRYNIPTSSITIPNSSPSIVFRYNERILLSPISGMH